MSAAMSRRFVAALAADEERRAVARKRAAERKALAAELDNKESPAATGLSTTHGGNP